jgi:hypothetical protein
MITSTPKLIAKKNGYEVWLRLDNSTSPAGFELFASEDCDDYIGEVDSMREARTFAAARFEELTTTNSYN